MARNELWALRWQQQFTESRHAALLYCCPVKRTHFVLYNSASLPYNYSNLKRNICDQSCRTSHVLSSFCMLNCVHVITGLVITWNSSNHLRLFLKQDSSKTIKLWALSCQCAFILLATRMADRPYDRYPWIGGLERVSSFFTRTWPVSYTHLTLPTILRV